MPRCWFCCCRRHNRVHPLELVDVGEINLEFYTDVLNQTPARANQTNQTSEITPLFAAAVSGDKSYLTKLLSSGWSSSIDAVDKYGRTALVYSILSDHMEICEQLLKLTDDVNMKDALGRTALHWAALKGNSACVKMLLNRGADRILKDRNGATPIHLCTRNKSAKCLALLMRQLQPGAIDDQDCNKRTALHLASAYGNLDQVRQLIRQDSNIGIPDVEGKTPLHWAASSHDPQAVDCVQLILDTTPSVIDWQDYSGCTALHLAVADGNVDVVQALISIEKCNVSALDNMFRTPLHWAAVLGHSQIVTMLLESKADYSSSDSNGATPLHYAAQNNFAETVEVFLSYPGLRDEVDIEGHTAFMWAAGKGANDVVACFLRRKIDLLQTDKIGATALHMAALAGHSSTVQILLNSGIPVDITDLSNHTPLLRACEAGHLDVTQTLIDHGAKVDIQDQDGRCPLHWAALGGHARICQILLKYGVNPNIQDLAGRTPLHCAAYGGFVNCMSVLMEHKADPNSQDKEGVTSLHWACSKGHMDAIKNLIQYHAYPNIMEFTEDRYTALDYALMGEHLEVCQYLIVQGALSITGIQDIAALKIQAWFRGYRVRKTFLERKKLLMKHEQLRKDAARKRAKEESKRREEKFDFDASSSRVPNNGALNDSRNGAIDGFVNSGFSGDELNIVTSSSESLSRQLDPTVEVPELNNTDVSNADRSCEMPPVHGSLSNEIAKQFDNCSSDLFLTADDAEQSTLGPPAVQLTPDQSAIQLTSDQSAVQLTSDPSAIQSTHVPLADNVIQLTSGPLANQSICQPVDHSVDVQSTCQPVDPSSEAAIQSTLAPPPAVHSTDDPSANVSIQSATGPSTNIAIQSTSGLSTDIVSQSIGLHEPSADIYI